MGGVEMRWRNALLLGVGAALLSGSAAQAADELSTTDRLQDRREIASGTRAYATGFEDGRFYANGWHITGEMGGVWTPPLKLLDGLWFGVDGQWAAQATKFTSGRGYARFDLPAISGLSLSRADFVPDGTRAALFGLTLTNPGSAAKTTQVKVDARSELMPSYPWGWTTPGAAVNLPDSGSFDGNALAFRDQGTPAGLEAHDYTAIVAANAKPDSGTTGAGFWGAQPGPRCAAHAPGMPRGRGLAGDAERLRRRPLRQRHGRRADLHGHGSGRALAYRLGRGRRLRREPAGRPERARRRAARPGPPARAEGRLA